MCSALANYWVYVVDILIRGLDIFNIITLT